jgi:hypothetical protein
MILVVALIAAAALGGFFAGFLFGLGVAADRVRHYRDVHTEAGADRARFSDFIRWFEGRHG